MATIAQYIALNFIVLAQGTIIDSLLEKVPLWKHHFVSTIVGAPEQRSPLKVSFYACTHMHYVRQ